MLWKLFNITGTKNTTQRQRLNEDAVPILFIELTWRKTKYAQRA